MPSLACDLPANTELEKIYCQLKAKPEGRGLPRYDDFRRNPPSMQHLLLKRPAEKAGIPLPKLASPIKREPANKPAAPKNKTPANRTVDNQAQKSPANTGRPTGKKPLAYKPSARLPAVPGASLSGCEMQWRQVICGQRLYQLRDNRHNGALGKEALTANNRLQFAAVPNVNDNNQLHAYLRGAYQQYLAKMDSIGLAGVTLTYTKFFYLFENAQSQQQDFVGRFTTMFEFLKKDKSAMAAGQQHVGKQPPALSLCEAVGKDFIVCDEAGTNWVFKLL